MQVLGGGTVKMEDVEAACPYCGAVGRVPDGIYDFVRESVRLLRQVNREEALSLIDVLQRYEQDESSDEEVAAAAPAEVRSFIREVLAKADKKFWIGIILTLLIVIYQKYDSSVSTTAIQNDISRNSEVLRQQLNQLSENDQRLSQQLHQLDENHRQLSLQVSDILNELQEEPASCPTARSSPPATSLDPPERLPNKNDPCWCGSQRAYKRCHRSQP